MILVPPWCFWANSSAWGQKAKGSSLLCGGDRGWGLLAVRCPVWAFSNEALRRLGLGVQ